MEKFLIDKCLPRLNHKTGEHEDFWRTYYWAERPDKEEHGADDQYHWHPDSEHTTEASAKARVEQLESGAKKQSILVRH